MEERINQRYNIECFLWSDEFCDDVRVRTKFKVVLNARREFETERLPPRIIFRTAINSFYSPRRIPSVHGFDCEL